MSEKAVEVKVSPKLLGYLDALIESEHGYGHTREAVALWLIWNSINWLREPGRELDRREIRVLDEEEAPMPSETEGLEVVRYLSKYTDRCIPLDPGDPVEWEPLVRQSEHLAALERAREEGRREVYRRVTRRLSRHSSNEGRTVLGQLASELRRRWPEIRSRGDAEQPPPPEGGGRE